MEARALSAGAAITELAGTLAALLDAEKSATGDLDKRADLGEFIRLLRPFMVEAGLTTIESGPRPQLPVCRYLAASLGVASGGASCLVPPLRQLAPHFCWTQNPNYRRSPPSPDFLERYGYAVIAGPKDGAPALTPHPDLAFGLLLLGPETTYPAHSHPASELYVPLGPAEWMKGDAPFVEHKAGSIIHHPQNLTHATRTGSSPLAALYLWAGDLGTHARLGRVLINRGS
jgi:hypothetical protein